MGRGQKTIIPTTITRVPPAREGRESSNPATTTTHSGMGAKETHNYMLWEIKKEVKSIYKNGEAE